MAEPTLMECRRLLQMAKDEGDPVGIDWWTLQIMKHEFPKQYEAAMAHRRKLDREEAQRNG